MKLRIRLVVDLEQCLFAVGVFLLASWAVASLYRSVYSQLALREFDNSQTNLSAVSSQPLTKVGFDAEVDFKLWSGTRVQAYRKTLPVRMATPLAVLDIPKLGIRVPVFEGTNELVLNRGVGWIAGTTHPGEPGNIGIAGHRDSFFRGLKDASIGDVIKLSTTAGTAVYTVDQIEIVQPDNVSVLQPRTVPSLTLVTCYPFYFIGSAPSRFIVHAALQNHAAAGSSTPVSRSHDASNSTNKE